MLKFNIGIFFYNLMGKLHNPHFGELVQKFVTILFFSEYYKLHVHYINITLKVY